MFDSKYYKKRYIYPLEDNGYRAMIEIVPRIHEYFIYLPDNEKEGEYAIYSRDLDKRHLEFEKLIPLKAFLIENGYTDTDFANPFRRTKKIVNELDKINIAEKEKTYIKK